MCRRNKTVIKLLVYVLEFGFYSLETWLHFEDVIFSHQ